MSEQDIKNKEEIVSIIKELGRDVSKLKLEKKTSEELTDAVNKLRVIRYSFKMLFSNEGNHNLAIHLLAQEFGENPVPTN